MEAEPEGGLGGHVIYQFIQEKLVLDPAILLLGIYQKKNENTNSGVPVVVQWLTNPTRNHEVAGLVPALAQWVNDPALL